MATADDRASDVGDTPDASRMGEPARSPTSGCARYVAIIDAPDIDSIADENRALANQLLAAADLGSS